MKNSKMTTTMTTMKMNSKKRMSMGKKTKTKRMRMKMITQMSTCDDKLKSTGKIKCCNKKT